MADEWEQVAAIGVDAGMVWRGDPAYTMTPDTPYALAPSWQDFVRLVFEKMAGGDVARFVKNDDWGDTGVAVLTGMGDGIYPVYIRRDPETGRIAERRVEFLPRSN
jgi:hypothetical protein